MNYSCVISMWNKNGRIDIVSTSPRVSINNVFLSISRWQNLSFVKFLTWIYPTIFVSRVSELVWFIFEIHRWQLYRRVSINNTVTNRDSTFFDKSDVQNSIGPRRFSRLIVDIEWNLRHETIRGLLNKMLLSRNLVELFHGTCCESGRCIWKKGGERVRRIDVTRAGTGLTVAACFHKNSYLLCRIGIHVVVHGKAIRHLLGTYVQFSTSDTVRAWKRTLCRLAFQTNAQRGP